MSSEQVNGQQSSFRIVQEYPVKHAPDNLGEFDNIDVIRGWVNRGEDGTEDIVEQAGFSYRWVQKGPDYYYETPLKKDAFDALWPTTIRRAEITRHVIPYAGAIILFDAYDGDQAGQMAVSVTFTNAASAASFEAPEWLAAPNNEPQA